MDTSFKRRRVSNPREDDTCFSALLFCWTLKVFRLGNKRDLEEDDLPEALKEHNSKFLGDKLSKLWCEHLKHAKRTHKEPNLGKVLLHCFKTPLYAFALVAVFLELVVRWYMFAYFTQKSHFRQHVWTSLKAVHCSHIVRKCFPCHTQFAFLTMLKFGHTLKELFRNIESPKAFSLFWTFGVVLNCKVDIFRLQQPIYLGLLIRYYGQEHTTSNVTSTTGPTYYSRIFAFNDANQSPISDTEAIYFTCALIVISILAVIIQHPYMLGVMHCGMKIRIALCSLMYRKTLLLDIREGGTASVLNLMSSDVNRFDSVLLFFHHSWIAVVQTLMICYFLYLMIGTPALYGTMVILAVVPIQLIFAFMTNMFRTRGAELTDKRVRLMNEIILGIQTIKMYAWENAFSKMMYDARKEEIRILQHTIYIKGATMSMILIVSRLAIFVATCTYAKTNPTITAEKVFITTAFFQILRQTMTVYFPQACMHISEALVAMKRIQAYLLAMESVVCKTDIMFPTKGVFMIGLRSDNKNPMIRLKDATVTIDNHDLLRHITLEISKKNGPVTAIVGNVGSGKTTLLFTIMKELTLSSGSLIVDGILSYASQEPWLFAGSIRQNITFGNPFDFKRYTSVIRSCALLRDLMAFPYRDRTIVGERGVSLSGGQKARINLARAIYKYADIYLLDDPLSAVDPQVAKQLIDQCLFGFLKDKLSVLVTHQVQLLTRLDNIILLSGGEIVTKGSYEQIKSVGPIVPSSGTTLQPMSVKEKSEDLKRSVISLSFLQEDKSKHGLAATPIVEAEMRTLGSLGFTVFKEYFLAGGNILLVGLLFFLFILSQCLVSAADLFLSFWVKDEKVNGTAHRTSYVQIYSGLMGVAVIVSLGRSFYFFSHTMRSSERLHNSMFDTVIHATMKFFNTNVSGRILNRFSKDVSAMDELLPYAMIDTYQVLHMLVAKAFVLFSALQIMLNMAGLIVVIFIVNKLLSISLVPILIMFYFLRRYYVKTSRSVKRLDGITRSPMYAHVNATLQGLQTIRSNNAEKILVNEFDNHQNLNSSAFYYFIGTSRAFGYWLDQICALYIAFISLYFLFFALYGAKSNYMDADVGLIITQIIGLTGVFQWGMRQSAEMENQMTSVERILEFRDLDREPILITDRGMRPPKNWPPKGEIKFANTSVSYSKSGEPVLKNLNFSIRPKEKIGIVGRTGAGKSSLISAIFRMGYYDGEINIDDIEIGSVPLKDLRKKLTIIPQEPFLFSGTLRYNLDPYNEYTTDNIVSALVYVELLAPEEISLAEGVLESSVGEGGSRLSIGQRQLVCLARAILRNNKILVMDEATANVDPHTDQLIQTTIRHKFADCTVLTIAHRLQTVMDADRIILMDAGRLREMEHPHVLIQNHMSKFRHFVDEVGPPLSHALKQIAEESFKRAVAKGTWPVENEFVDSAGMSLDPPQSSDVSVPSSRRRSKKKTLKRPKQEDESENESFEDQDEDYTEEGSSKSNV